MDCYLSTDHGDNLQGNTKRTENIKTKEIFKSSQYNGEKKSDKQTTYHCNAGYISLT